MLYVISIKNTLNGITNENSIGIKMCTNKDGEYAKR